MYIWLKQNGGFIPRLQIIHYESSRIKNTKTISTKPSSTTWVAYINININIYIHGISPYNITNITKPQNAHIVPRPQPAKPFFLSFCTTLQARYRIWECMYVSKAPQQVQPACHIIKKTRIRNNKYIARQRTRRLLLENCEHIVHFIIFYESVAFAARNMHHKI